MCDIVIIMEIMMSEYHAWQSCYDDENFILYQILVLNECHDP